MTPSTIKTICTGVVLAAVAATRSAGSGSTLNGSTRGAAAAIKSSLAAMGRVIVAASIKGSQDVEGWLPTPACGECTFLNSITL